MNPTLAGGLVRTHVCSVVRAHALKSPRCVPPVRWNSHRCLPRFRGRHGSGAPTDLSVPRDAGQRITALSLPSVSGAFVGGSWVAWPPCRACHCL